MATWIVGLVIVAAIYFAAKSVWQNHKSGGCSGCSSCSSGCGHCTQLKHKPVNK